MSSKRRLQPILDSQQVPNSFSNLGTENIDSSSYDSNPVSNDLDDPLHLGKEL